MGEFLLISVKIIQLTWVLGHAGPSGGHPSILPYSSSGFWIPSDGSVSCTNSWLTREGKHPSLLADEIDEIDAKQPMSILFYSLFKVVQTTGINSTTQDHECHGN